MKCIECSECILTTDEVGCTHARCKAFVPPKKGRVIAWAYTTYASEIYIMIRQPSQTGTDRVNEILSKKKKAPSWCPLCYN